MAVSKNESDLAAMHGIEARHESMPNGELRFRLYGPDGNGYIRTVAGTCGAWQNSHYHLHVRETYIVERGWMVLAEWDEKQQNVNLTRFDEGCIVTTSVGREHNVYLPEHAVIHTVKHGAKSAEADWHPAERLDRLTKCLTNVDIDTRSVRGGIRA